MIKVFTFAFCLETCYIILFLGNIQKQLRVLYLHSSKIVPYSVSLLNNLYDQNMNKRLTCRSVSTRVVKPFGMHPACAHSSPTPTWNPNPKTSLSLFPL